MKYIIDEEELNLFRQNVILYESCNQKNVIKDFLKNKKPVEMIASGIYDAIQLYWHTDTNPIIQKSSNVDYTGKSIKIYIEECND